MIPHCFVASKLWAAAFSKGGRASQSRRGNIKGDSTFVFEYQSSYLFLSLLFYLFLQITCSDFDVSCVYEGSLTFILLSFSTASYLFPVHLRYCLTTPENVITLPFYLSLYLPRSRPIQTQALCRVLQSPVLRSDVALGLSMHS